MSRQPATGQIKSVDLPLSKSDADTETAVALVHSYAGTRPIAEVAIFVLNDSSAAGAARQNKLLGDMIRAASLTEIGFLKGRSSAYCGHAYVYRRCRWSDMGAL